MRISSFFFLALANAGVVLSQATGENETRHSVLPYLFSIPGNAIFTVVFGLLAIAHFTNFLLYRSQRRGSNDSGTKWTLTLPIAELTMTLGFIFRLVCRSNQYSIGLYAVCNLLILLSPAAFLGFIYLAFSRLLRITSPPSTAKTPNDKLPKRRKIGTFFIWSDIVTFLIQASGGGLQASASSKAIGDKLFLAGVSLQCASYFLFLGITVFYHVKESRQGTLTRTTRFFLLAIYLASIGVIVRSVYRIVEMAGGYTGHIYRTELFLLFLDSLPLALANLVWVLVWPPRIFEQILDEVMEQHQSANRNDFHFVEGRSASSDPKFEA
ncbi:RTA1-domain-containing protein [Acaromyces ingoldii]|uniref:RTA1-domain-containing protein n=1 Tax=Acaromyces ingoldii TaxID=215250 RepID=A0A316Z075_9BASI|nr:RTA1-domain-containing protein [Acaromyces ingoldii]PWN93495.1 RTA1-domain-containing protein [Acaromyces ingoldii]